MAAKKKPASTGPISLKIADGDPGNIGGFVQKRYGKKPLAFQQRLYNQLRSQGKEYTDTFAPLSPEMAQQKPEGYNTPDVGGPFKDKPNYDSSQYNLLKNRYGRYFLEKINPLTGLSGAERSQVSAYDTQTNQHNDSLQNAYALQASSIAASNAKSAEALKQLQDLRGNQTTLPTGQPTQANPGEGVSQAALLAQQTAAQTAASEKTRATVQGAETIANQSFDPNVAKQTGANASANYLAQRGTGRTSLVNTLQQQRATREYNDKVLKARALESKNTLIAATAAQQGQNYRAELSSKTDIAKTEMTLNSQEKREIARLRAAGSKTAQARADKIRDNATKRNEAALKDATSYITGPMVQGDTKWTTITNPDGTKQETQVQSGGISPDKLRRTLTARYGSILSAGQINALVAQAYPGMANASFQGFFGG